MQAILRLEAIVDNKEEIKEALKKALKEWMDEKYLAFGKFAIWSIISLAFGAVIYMILWVNGWRFHG